MESNTEQRFHPSPTKIVMFRDSMGKVTNIKMNRADRRRMFKQIRGK
jgi:hypothetical protein